MHWTQQLHNVPKPGSPAAINAITSATVIGDFADDANGAAHLSAAKSAANAAVAGLTGAAAMVDVSISVVCDNSPAIAGSYAAGTRISIDVVEKY
ncbi:MAG TPA: hypothetical protein VMV27_00705 [Candidatus Binataceae bacterium]|nr:hypothetical protein [Candidatus Binataceae bacterium]